MEGPAGFIGGRDPMELEALIWEELLLLLGGCMA